MRKIAALLLVMVMVFAFAACNKSSTPPASSGGSSSSGSSGSGSSTPAAPSGGGDQKVFYWIGKVPGGGYWSGVEAGLRGAAEEFDLDVRMFGIERETDVERQVNLLADAVSAKPDAILIAPCDSNALAKPVQEAHAAGIPIILVDTKIAADDGFTAAILTNNIQAGKTCAKLLADFLKADGKTKGYVGVLVASTGSQTANDRMDGFREYWEKEANLPDVTVLWDEIKVSDGDATKAISSVKDMMTKYGDELVGFFGGTGDSVNIGNAMRETGNKDVVVVGMDFNVDSHSRLSEGFMRGSCAQQTYKMGYEGCKLALAAIDGKTFEGDDKFIDSGLLPITMDNIDSDEVKLILDLINR